MNVDEDIINTSQDKINNTDSKIKQQQNRISSKQFKQSDYDPFKIPPNIQIAELHRKAKKVGITAAKNQEEDGQTCVCCNLPVDKIDFSYKEDPDNFAELGPGTALFFDFVKYCSFILILIFTVSGIYGFISQQIYCNKEGVLDCVNINGLLYPKKFQGNGIGVQLYLNFIAVILTIFALLFAKVYLKLKEQQFDALYLTPKDYTVMVKRVDPAASSEELQEFLENSSTQLIQRPIKIERVIEVYKISNYIDAFRKKVDLIAKLDKMVKLYHQTKDNKYNLEQQKLNAKIQEQDLIINKLDNSFVLNTFQQHKSHLALVTFRTQQDKDEVLEKWKMSKFQTFLTFFGFEKFNSYKVFKGKRLLMVGAAEPLDYIWENLEITFNQRFCYRLISFLITLALLAISFLSISLLTQWQNNQNKSDGIDWLTAQFISIFSSFVILIINFLIYLVLIYLSSFERHSTYTFQSRSLGVFLGWAQFINSALIPFILLAIPDTNFTDEDMIQNLFYIFLGNALATNIILIIDPMYYYKIFQQKRLKKNLFKTSKTQYEANSLFEDPPFYIDEKYAFCNKTFLTALFYAPIFPLGLLMELLGLIAFYWICKYVFVTRSSYPNQIAGNLNNTMLSTAFCGPMVFSIGSLSYDYFVLHNNNEGVNLGLHLTCIILSALCFFFSSNIFKLTCIKQWMKNKKQGKDLQEHLLEIVQLQNQPFQQAKPYFGIDYDDANPITNTKNNIETSSQQKALGFYYGQQGYQDHQSNPVQQQKQAQNIRLISMKNGLANYVTTQPTSNYNAYYKPQKAELQVFNRNNMVMSRFIKSKQFRKQQQSLYSHDIEFSQNTQEIHNTSFLDNHKPIPKNPMNTDEPINPMDDDNNNKKDQSQINVPVNPMDDNQNNDTDSQIKQKKNLFENKYYQSKQDDFLNKYYKEKEEENQNIKNNQIGINNNSNDSFYNKSDNKNDSNNRDNNKN